MMIIFVSGCVQQTTVEDTSGPMTGDEVRINAEAYRKMCEREPQSPLCPR